MGEGVPSEVVRLKIRTGAVQDFEQHSAEVKGGPQWRYVRCVDTTEEAVKVTTGVRVKRVVKQSRQQVVPLERCN